jgi:uncharacterized membrane protein YbhN (UPF0104 family)
VLLPKLAGLQHTWRRLDEGDPWWLVLAAGLELASFAAYCVVFRAVFDGHGGRLTLRESTLITMAGVAATRLVATGGAGGIVLMAWALRRRGYRAKAVGVGMVAFYVLLYGVYMAALVLAGAGLATGLLPGDAPDAVTVLPALFGLGVILTALALTFVPRDLGARLRRRVLRRLAVAPAVFGAGVRRAIALLRTGDWRLSGAVGWWAFDIAVLWACFEAFGDAPPAGVLVMAYFVGMLGNLLPLPGGVGGVDGGMIGVLIACGVDGGLAIVAVLTYRAFAFWLPTLPGIAAYLSLRRWPAPQPAGAPRTAAPPRPMATSGR